MGKHNRKYFDILFILLVCIVLASVFQSCSSNSGTIVNPSSTSTKILVVNASPDINPIKVYVNNIQLGSFFTSFKYPTPSSYYGLSADSSKFVNITTDHGNGILHFTTSIHSGFSYSLFLVGLKSATVKADSLNVIFAADTSGVAKIGNGKIRFVNASPRSPALNLTANGTLAFSNVKYTGVSSFIELPAGIYDFKVAATTDPSTILADVSRITIQDGKLYTLFAHGIVNRRDTAAFGAAIITNK